MKLRRYNKKLDYSYTFGVFPTLELFKLRPDVLKQVLFGAGSDNSRGVPEIKRLCKRHGVTCDFSPKAVGRLSAKENTYVLGIFKKYKMKLGPNSNHVVLVEPSNTGNLGTIIRTMVGFKINDIAIIRPGVDIFDPKVIRSAMGSSFKVNCEYFDTFEQYQQKFSRRNIYTFRLNGKKILREVAFEKPYSLVFGNESSGLSPQFNDIGTGVRIDHTKDIDSLNLSVAVGVALYKASVI
ncbi:TrmH family RNA methyltransferase [bacterium]|nr:TrmH family RNA methyltransferase [bacterium]